MKALHELCSRALAARDRDIAELRGQVRNLQLAAMRYDDLRELVKLQATQILELQKVVLRSVKVKP